jgi:hypothetical protein
LNENKFHLETNTKLFIEDLIGGNDRIVIFCTSYPCVTIVISLLESIRNREKNVELLVSNNDLYRLFETYFKKYYRHISNYNREPHFYKKMYDISGIILEKIYLLRLKKQIHYSINAHVLFFSWDFVDRNFYLLNFLKHNNANKIFNIRIGNLGPGFKENTIKRKLKTKILQFLYGRKITLLRAGEQTFTRIKNSFFSNVNVYDINYNEVKTTFKVNKKWKIDKHIEIIYFDAPFNNSKEDKILKLKIHLFKKLNNYVNSKINIGIKYHPGRTKEKSLLKYGTEVTGYLPAELLDYSVCKLAIGFGSYTLSKSNIQNIPGICLMYLVGSENNLEVSIKKQMRSLNENLFYPKSISELDKIIENILVNE